MDGRTVVPKTTGESRREQAFLRSLELKAEGKARTARERLLWRMNDPGAYGPDRGAGVPIPGSRPSGLADDGAAPYLPPLPGRGWPFGGA
jgi:hypothetical protein